MTAMLALSLIAAMSQPAYLKPVINEYGQTVVAVGNPGKPVCNKPISKCHPTLIRNGKKVLWNPVRARHHYSTSPTWNADGSLMFLDRGSSTGRVVLDGRTFEPLFQLILEQPERIMGEDFPYNWHPTNPRWVVMAWGKALGVIDIHTQRFVRYHVLEGYRHIHFGHHTVGRPDDVTGRVWPIVGERYDGESEAFLVHFSRDYSSFRLSRKIRLSDFGRPTPNKGVILAPDASAILIVGCLTGHRHKDCAALASVDIDTGKRNWTSLDYHVPGHGDVWLDREGGSWIVGNVKDEVRDRAGRVIQDFERHVVKRHFTTGEIVDLFVGEQRYVASHTSCRAIRARLCVTSGFERPITLVDPETGRRRKLANPRAARAGYFSEIHASISPTGEFVAFASNWGNVNNPVVTYVVTTGGRP